MDPILLATQALNGLQLGVMLFLMAAGMTLVFGIMGLINLAHGSLYMAGAYAMAATFGATGSFLAGLGAALAAVAVLGAAMEYAVLRRLYARDHLDQVLATFGFILVFNELARMIWGRLPSSSPCRPHCRTRSRSSRAPLPRLPAGGDRRRHRRGDRPLPADRPHAPGHADPGGRQQPHDGLGPGVDIGRLYTLVFALGAALAGLAGAMAGPVLSVEPGMGEPVLILTLVVIVVGGIGSIRGAFVAALLIGFIDTIGRAFLPALLRDLLAPSAANAVGPALASMLIYLTMAVVLAIRPQGLFAARTG